MTMQTRQAIRTLILAAGLVAASLMTAGAGLAQPKPQNPQPAAVQPGLIPVYYRNITFESVEEVVRYAAKRKGDTGQPIENIDAKGSAGNLWDSGTKKQYGIRITGLIRVEAGTYEFSATSNDGFRLLVGGAKVLEDGDIHVDRTTKPGAVTFSQAGWYPLELWYFQKGGGATMQLMWKTPGGAGPVAVPAASFGHM